ncbi:MAG TPA: hypothetical protein VG328_01885 [Stellaceae bacterium]|nr:hypothetical protein [Stellaceae bacterium]
MTTRRQFILTGLSLGAGFTLVSCGPPSQAPEFPDIRFTGQPPFMLQASQVEIRTIYQPGDADNAFPVSPLRAVQNWARDRLRATGQGGPARFTIADATAKVTDLTVKGGISGTFTDQVSQRYDIALDAALELLDSTGVVVRSARVTVSRSATVLQSATANDRARTRYGMVRDMMADFDSQAQQRIMSGFGQYLLSN